MPSEAQPLAGAVIAFDLDGTLVDSAPDLVATLNHILAEEGIAPLPFDQGRSLLTGHAWRPVRRPRRLPDRRRLCWEDAVQECPRHRVQL